MEHSDFLGTYIGLQSSVPEPISGFDLVWRSPSWASVFCAGAHLGHQACVLKPMLRIILAADYRLDVYASASCFFELVSYSFSILVFRWP